VTSAFRDDGTSGRAIVMIEFGGRHSRVAGLLEGRIVAWSNCLSGQIGGYICREAVWGEAVWCGGEGSRNLCEMLTESSDLS
jgi:hypothetical protein